ncbi:hypothetical protein BV22DRAFT_983153, partial [Leucogyrophana mollusca]
ELMCWARGDDINRIFLVKIAEKESVYTLKEQIKEMRPAEFSHVHASDFNVSKVSVPIDDNLRQNLGK